MSKDKKTGAEQEVRYTRQALLRSPEFARYQQDFLSAVLSSPSYTVAEAKQALRKFFGKE